MTSQTAVLKQILERHAAAPFLFIGSGFSRRYLGLESWEALLARFCEPIKEFGYYRSRASGDLPGTATQMAADYNEWWWSEENKDEDSEAFKKLAVLESDTLKYDIAKYISSLSLDDARKSEFGGELASIADISVDGVITTNWDYLIEEIFPDYKVFVGQEELLFSNPQSIGEIYKIHGSASDPYLLFSLRKIIANFPKKILIWRPNWLLSSSSTQSYLWVTLLAIRIYKK